jgi:hypothetical protein
LSLSRLPECPFPFKQFLNSDHPSREPTRRGLHFCGD